MQLSNVANDNYGFPASWSSVALSVSGFPLSHQVSGPGQPSEMAAMAAFLEQQQFDLQGNVAQIDLQRKSPMPGSDELTDAKIEAVDARTDTKITRLEGKIDVLTATIVGKINSLKDDVSKSDQYNHDTRWVLISTFVVGVFALAGLLVAIATYGDALFGRGMSVRDVVQTVIKEQQEIQKRDATLQPRH